MRHDLVIALQNLGVFSAGLVGAGQIFVLFVVIRTLRAMRPLDSLHLHQAMLSTDYPDVYIQPAGILAFVLVADHVEPRLQRRDRLHRRPDADEQQTDQPQARNVDGRRRRPLSARAASLGPIARATGDVRDDRFRLVHHPGEPLAADRRGRELERPAIHFLGTSSRRLSVFSASGVVMWDVKAGRKEQR